MWLIIIMIIAFGGALYSAPAVLAGVTVLALVLFVASRHHRMDIEEVISSFFAGCLFGCVAGFFIAGIVNFLFLQGSNGMVLLAFWAGSIPVSGIAAVLLGMGD